MSVRQAQPEAFSSSSCLRLKTKVCRGPKSSHSGWAQSSSCGDCDGAVLARRPLQRLWESAVALHLHGGGIDAQAWRRREVPLCQAAWRRCHGKVPSRWSVLLGLVVVVGGTGRRGGVVLRLAVQTCILANFLAGPHTGVAYFHAHRHRICTAAPPSRLCNAQGLGSPCSPEALAGNLCPTRSSQGLRQAACHWTWGSGVSDAPRAKYTPPDGLLLQVLPVLLLLPLSPLPQPLLQLQQLQLPP